MFDKEGSFLRSIAGTRGQGPGELMNPTEFDIDEKGRIWIADPPNGRVHIYGPDGSFSHDIQLDHRPHRVSVFDDGSGFYTVWLSPTNSALFARYDGDGNLQKKVGQIVENQAKRGMALGGNIAVTSDRSFYFTMTRAGRLMRYNAQGETVFDVETIDSAPIPEVVVDDRGGRRVDPSASILSLDLQITKEKIAILAIVENSSAEDVQRAFDIYNTEGQYEHSVPLPKGTSRACLTSNRIYTLTDTSLVAWDYST
jgi:hypothetical protein